VEGSALERGLWRGCEIGVFWVF